MSSRVRDNLSSKVASKSTHISVNLQNDIEVFRVLLKYTRCIGVTPLSMKANSPRRVITKCVVSSLVMAYFLFNFITFILKVKYDRFDNTFFVFIKTLFYVSRTLFVTTSLAKANLFHCTNWKKIFATLKQIDLMMVKFNFRVTRTRPLLYFDTFAGIIVCVFSRIFHSVVLIYFGRPHEILTLLGWAVFPVYMTSVTTFLYILAKILHSRYDHMDAVVVKLQEITDINVLRSRIGGILKVYKNLHLLVEEYNYVFGLQIFLCVFSTFVIIVRLLSRVVIDTLLIGINMTIVMILYTAIYLYSLVLLTMACESVEKSGRSVVKNCYNLHGTEEDYQIKEQILLLVTYLKRWSPTFSAAGFFNVNQRTLPALVSAIVSYLVLVEQFDLSLQEEKKKHSRLV
ncbi:gustatory receptor 68a-like [Anoplophora glabripennis]|uniref:gustatory receptor 68a-like n=1 Tax=Anoplophora glabripennis TaxID=217634 RepID=UPI0008746A55|nr:gustatory receptor 68a-like [Anoplophora glabripennis]